ncbi:hypothetical protein [Fulvivirga lutimaris]|uniref:hypothetical protein n=1 Tax=Fulvivirga lutimaris TaxID=1819566 RepID=UPI0012BC47DE|nr:hypothetical protein [Fulvivirga lutimaris]MTI41183.1 hypothetical protein [Fulvivirga lutimaris]
MNISFIQSARTLALAGFMLLSARTFAQGPFYSAESRGPIENNQINEASGLATGINNPNMLWTHNDSGDKARIFLLDEYGHFKAEFKLKGVNNRDWEDIYTGPGPKAGKNYIYIAEMGDNNAVHELKYIYRFEEPKLSDDSREISNIEVITFVYPDGKRDAESLFVDPQTKDIYILSKREQNIGIYKAAYPQSLSKTVTLEKLGEMPYFNTVAADITPDGQEILTKTYDGIYYWKRNGQSIADLLMTEPTFVPYVIEPQGESIAWKKDGSGFFTLSEEPREIEAVLYFYRRR